MPDMAKYWIFLRIRCFLNMQPTSYLNRFADHVIWTCLPETQHLGAFETDSKTLNNKQKVKVIALHVQMKLSRLSSSRNSKHEVRESYNYWWACNFFNQQHFRFLNNFCLLHSARNRRKFLQSMDSSTPARFGHIRYWNQWQQR